VPTPRVVVLCYHGVTPSQQAAFAQQMHRVARRAVDLETAANLLSMGPRRGGRPRIAVTFDDALANLSPNALPALRAQDIPATIFAVTGNLAHTPRWWMRDGHPDRRELTLAAHELREISSPRYRVASHTHTHPHLTHLSAPLLRTELIRSREKLAQVTGGEVIDLALPYGDGDERVVSAALRAGYRRVWALDSRSIPGSLARSGVNPSTGWIRFALICAGASMQGMRRRSRPETAPSVVPVLAR